MAGTTPTRPKTQNDVAPRRTRRMAAAAAVATGATVVALWAAPPAHAFFGEIPANGSLYQIALGVDEPYGHDNAPSDRENPSVPVLDVPGSSPSSGLQMQTWPANDTSAQRWVPEFTDMLHNSWMRLRNLATGLCLDLEGGSNAEGTAVVQWPCHGGDNQLWYTDSNPIRQGYLYSKVGAGTWGSNRYGPALKVANTSAGTKVVVTQGTATKTSFGRFSYWEKTQKIDNLRPLLCYPTDCSNNAIRVRCHTGYTVVNGVMGTNSIRTRNLGSPGIAWEYMNGKPVPDDNDTALEGHYYNSNTTSGTGYYEGACFLVN